uniref:Uncharacterized protein n=1 Tax=Arundo donax TaxID=35708 RepID=A0A0A9FH42_ARUDO
MHMERVQQARVDSDAHATRLIVKHSASLL